MKIPNVTRMICLLLSLGLLVGCGAKEVDSSVVSSTTEFGEIPETSLQETVTQQTRVQGTFTMPCNLSYSFDPYNSLSMENQAILDLVYEGLFTMNPSYDPEPMLCESYTTNEDGTQYTLTLRNASFSNGATLTADDVYYSMEKARDSDLYAARFRDISSFAVTSPTTIVIYLNNPNDRLPCMLDFPIVPNYSATSNALGTGPYVRNGTTNLTPNRYWWQGSENLSVTSISLYNSLSAEDTRDQFEVNTVHFVYNDPSSLSSATYHCDYELWNSGGTTMQYLGFNNSSGIFQDNRVRSAVVRAIDRAEIAETVYHNYADAAVLPLSPSSSMYDESLALNYSYNRDEALSQLLASGSFYLPDNHPVVTGAIYDEDFDFDEYMDTITGVVKEEAEDDNDAQENAEDEATADMEEATEEPATEDEAEDAYTDTTAYNRITMLVISGNTLRSESADLIAEQLMKVGFAVTVTEMDYDNFIYTLNNLKEEWDLYLMDVSLTPDFDLRSILYPGNKLNYNNIPEDSTLRSLYYNALENSGNRYDLYQYLMDKAYLCPILFENNAVYTTRGVFSGLNPAPGNLFYGIANMTINS